MNSYGNIAIFWYKTNRKCVCSSRSQTQKKPPNYNPTKFMASLLNCDVSCPKELTHKLAPCKFTDDTINHTSLTTAYKNNKNHTYTHSTQDNQTAQARLSPNALSSRVIHLLAFRATHGKPARRTSKKGTAATHDMCCILKYVCVWNANYTNIPCFECCAVHQSIGRVSSFQKSSPWFMRNAYFKRHIFVCLTQNIYEYTRVHDYI